MLGWWRPGWKGGRVGFSWPLGRVEGLGWARPGLAYSRQTPTGWSGSYAIFNKRNWVSWVISFVINSIITQSSLQQGRHLCHTTRKKCYFRYLRFSHFLLRCSGIRRTYLRCHSPFCMWTSRSWLWNGLSVILLRMVRLGCRTSSIALRCTKVLSRNLPTVYVALLRGHCLNKSTDSHLDQVLRIRESVRALGQCLLQALMHRQEQQLPIQHQMLILEYHGQLELRCDSRAVIG